MAERPRGRPLGWTSLALRLAASRLGLLAASMLTALVAATLLVTASVLALAGASDTADVLIVGAFEPADREHPLWRGLGHGVLLDDEDSATVVGPLIVPVDDLVERVRPGSTTAIWTVGLDLTPVSFDAADAAIRSLAGLRDGLADVPTGDQATRISIGGGTDVLARARDAALSAQAVLLVVVTMVTVLAAWALAFTARILAAGRAS